jgi:hypothetical protein
VKTRNVLFSAAMLMLAAIAFVAFLSVGGCALPFTATPVSTSTLATVTQPSTTQPAVTLTSQQVQAINGANQAMAAVDNANWVFQLTAAFDPALAPYAVAANDAANDVDSLTGQYTAAVASGKVIDATSINKQIQADIQTVLTAAAKKPATTAPTPPTKTTAVPSRAWPASPPSPAMAAR